MDEYGAEALAVALGEGGVWVARSDDSFADAIEVVRIDPASALGGERRRRHGHQDRPRLGWR